MIIKYATVVSPAGLHARIVSLLADCVKGYAGLAEIIWGDKKANIKNMLELLALSVPTNSEVAIQVTGPDETMVAVQLAAIVELAE